MSSVVAESVTKEHKLSSETTIFFISHASVGIRYKEHILVTDPWYIKPAFTTWKTSPCATLSVDALSTMSYGGKLGFLISHAHGDHYDPEFLKLCWPGSPVFICKFPNSQFRTSLQNDCGLNNVTEITSYDEAGVKWGPFNLNAWLDPGSDFDSLLSIKCPDAFIFHGNDAWGITDQKLGDSVARVKSNCGRCRSLFMGQGGTASGWPLTYFCYTEDEKTQLLTRKVEQMVSSIHKTCDKYEFDRALAYAMLSRIDLPGKRYSFKTPTMTGKRANNLCGSSLFLDLHPGDVYIPRDDRVVKILGSLKYTEMFQNNMGESPDFGPDIAFENWVEEGYHELCKSFVTKTLPEYIAAELGKDSSMKNPQQLTECGKWVEKDFDLRFKLLITNNYQENKIVDEISVCLYKGTREKVLRVPGKIMAKVCNGEIPFRDLYIGYLAEFSRTPKSVYNYHFIQAMHGCGVAFFKTKGIQIGTL